MGFKKNAPFLDGSNSQRWRSRGGFFLAADVAGYLPTRDNKLAVDQSGVSENGDVMGI